MNNPFNLIKFWKKYGWKKTKEEWTKKYLMLETPEQSVKKELVGHIGMMGALFFATVVFAFKGSYAIVAIFICALWLSYVNFKRSLKQLSVLNGMRKQFGNQNKEILEGENGN